MDKILDELKKMEEINIDFKKSAENERTMKSKEKEIHHSCNSFLSQNFTVNHIFYINSMVFESINSSALSLLYGPAPLPESTCANSFLF